jgi:hypothetical protein
LFEAGVVWFGYASVNGYIGLLFVVYCFCSGLFYALHGVVLLFWQWFVLCFA